MKKKCFLNSLEFFETSENHAVDIVHDIPEGVAKFELKLVYQHLVKKSISIKELCERVQNFNYGYLERKSRMQFSHGACCAIRHLFLEMCKKMILCGICYYF